MKTTEIFGINLRNMLIAKNKSQAALAKYVGVSQTSVSHWVNGTKLPRPKTIDKICAFLNCDTDYLMTDHSKPVELAPEDIIAEELRNNPKLMRLMFQCMKLSSDQLDILIEKAVSMK